MSQIDTTEKTQGITTDEDSVVINHVRRHAREYGLVMGTEAVPVLLEKRLRRQTVLYRFASPAGTERVILVKVPLLLSSARVQESGGGLQDGDQDSSGESPRQRPRIVPLVDFATKYRCEYEALDTIERHFGAMGDPRFGVVRVLDRIDSLRALVMEEIHETDLRRLFDAARRLSLARTRNLVPVYQNAGAWLHAFHGLPFADDRPVRQASREELVLKVRELSGYLAGEVGRRDAFQRIADTVSTTAEALLPEKLPVGMRHGDWAMRNIMVAPDNRVTVLDTLAYCRTPIYDDIAYFLTELKWSLPQIHSRGLAYSARRLAGYEQAFLEGYFSGGAIPWPAIRLYEVQAVLDKWAAWVARDRNQPSVSNRIADRWHRKAVCAAFPAIMRKLCRQVVRDAQLERSATVR